MRRIAAMSYDALLIAAIWIISTFLWVGLQDGDPVHGPAFQAFLYLEAAAFYIYFWRARGQTLGMQAWKIRAVSEDGEPMSLGECVARFFFATFSTALMGLGFLWMLFDRDRLTWHDRASGTCVLYLRKDPGKDPGKGKELSRTEGAQTGPRSGQAGTGRRR